MYQDIASFVPVTITLPTVMVRREVRCTLAMRVAGQLSERDQKFVAWDSLNGFHQAHPGTPSS